MFEEAVSVAASFACTLRNQESLDLMFVGAKAFLFTAGRGVAHTDQLLEILAGVSRLKQKISSRSLLWWFNIQPRSPPVSWS